MITSGWAQLGAHPTAGILIVEQVMKINDRIIDGPTPEVLVLPKGEVDFVFKAIAVLDEADFLAICPQPSPPEVIKAGGEKTYDFNDPEFDKLLDQWCNRKTSWIIITSLKATDGLEWDTVDFKDPETWGNYATELSKIFTDAEIARIVGLVHEANGLSQKMIDEARERFLAGQARGQNA